MIAIGMMSTTIIVYVQDVPCLSFYFDCLGPFLPFPLFSVPSLPCPFPFTFDPPDLAGAETVLAIGTPICTVFSVLIDESPPIVNLLVDLAISEVLLAKATGLARSLRVLVLESNVELRLACLAPLPVPPADSGG